MIKFLILLNLLILVSSNNYCPYGCINVNILQAYRCYVNNENLYFDPLKTLIDTMNKDLKTYPSTQGNYTLVNTEVIRTITNNEQYYLGTITWNYMCQLDNNYNCNFPYYSVTDCC